MSSLDPYSPSLNASIASGYAGGYEDQAFEPIHQLDPMRLVKAPFVSPNWIVNLIWMFLCELLAMFFIGNIIYLGYAGEVAIARSGGRDKRWPDFNLDRFSEYFMRGLWPTLWQFIGSFVASIVIGVPVLITVLTVIALGNNQQPAAAIVVGVVGGIVCLILMFALGVALQAITISSLLSNDFMRGADLNFVRTYVVNMFLQTLLAGLMIFVIMNGYSIVGLLLCGLGLLLVGPILRLIMCDLLAQMHDIHLSKGGPSAIVEPVGIVDAQVIG